MNISVIKRVAAMVLAVALTVTITAPSVYAEGDTQIDSGVIGASETGEISQEVMEDEPSAMPTDEQEPQEPTPLMHPVQMSMSGITPLALPSGTPGESEQNPARDEPELITALAIATSGDTVYLSAGSDTILIYSNISIPSGVTLTISGGGIIHHLGKFQNSGTINNACHFSNYGTINNNGSFINNGGFDNFDIINNNSGGSITNNRNITNYENGTINNNGTITNYSEVNNKGTITGNAISGDAPPNITTVSPLPDGTVDVAYSQTLEADNSPTSWSLDNSPAWLSINNSGALSGTPTAAGTENFDVIAWNARGSHSKVFSITVIDVPGTPTNVTAVAGDGEVTVSFDAPTDNGGSAITDYRVTCVEDTDKTAAGASSPITVTGLLNGTAYTFVVTATNIAGTGPASSASNSVMPTATTAPTINGHAVEIDVINLIEGYNAPFEKNYPIAGNPTPTVTVSGINSAGASVTDAGKLTIPAGLTASGSPYTATMQAENTEGTATMTVTVNVDPVPVAPSVSPTLLTIQEGNTGDLTVYLGEGSGAATSAAVTSLDSSIASVLNDPVTVVTSGTTLTVTGVSAGTTSIEVTWNGGSKNSTTTSVNVEVAAVHDPIDPPTGPVSPNSDALFTFGGNYADLDEIRLNGQLLTQVGAGIQKDLSGYPGYAPVLGKAEPGSVKVTLYKEFLQTLPNGVYSLTVDFADGGSGDLEFEIKNYTVTYSAGTGGSVSSGHVSGNSVVEGSIVTITATPKSGYTFSGWTVNGVSGGKQNPGTFTITQDTTITASFSYKSSSSGSSTYPTKKATEDIADTKTPLADEPDHTAYISGFSDGTFRPDSGLTRAEAAVLFYNLMERPVSTGSSFSDVLSGAWYYEAVSALSRAGVISGYPDGSFNPNGTITRAEFITMALRFMGIAEKSGATGDIENHWASGFMTAAVDAGYISGYPDGSFGPNNQVTRAEAVTILNRIIGCKGLSEGKSFSDVPKSHWAYEAIAAAATTHNH